MRWLLWVNIDWIRSVCELNQWVLQLVLGLSHRVLFFSLSIFVFASLSVRCTHSFVVPNFYFLSFILHHLHHHRRLFLLLLYSMCFFCYLHFCLLPVFLCVYFSAYHETVTLIKRETLDCERVRVRVRGSLSLAFDSLAVDHYSLHFSFIQSIWIVSSQNRL